MLIEQLSEQRPERDLPAFQRLTTFVSLLCAPAWPSRSRYQTALSTLASLCATNELLVLLGVELRAASVDWSAPFSVPAFLEDIPPTLLLARHAGIALSATLAQQSEANTWDQAALLASTEAALNSADSPTRYIGTQLIISAGTQTGWPQPWQNLVKTARADADSTIKHLAHSTFLITE